MTPEARDRRRERDRAYRAANREAIAARRKAAYQANPEPIKARVAARAAANPDRIRAYREANRERRNAQRRAWGEVNPERLAAYAAAVDPEAKRARNRARYAEHPERERQRVQAYRDAHPDVGRERDRRYREANAAKVYDKNAKRRARLKGATVEDVDRRVVHDRSSGICGICHAPVPFDVMTLDHIVPLALGGRHSYENTQPAHLSCNSRKGARA